MRLLLDTHAFLWFILAEPRLSATALGLITDPWPRQPLAPCIRADRVTLSGKYQSGPSSMVIDCRLPDELSSVPP